MECINVMVGICFILGICTVAVLFIFGTVSFFSPIVSAMLIWLAEKGESLAKQWFGDKAFR